MNDQIGGGVTISDDRTFRRCSFSFGSDLASGGDAPGGLSFRFLRSEGGARSRESEDHLFGRDWEATDWFESNWVEASLMGKGNEWSIGFGVGMGGVCCDEAYDEEALGTGANMIYLIDEKFALEKNGEDIILSGCLHESVLLDEASVGSGRESFEAHGAQGGDSGGLDDLRHLMLSDRSNLDDHRDRFGQSNEATPEITINPHELRVLDEVAVEVEENRPKVDEGSKSSENKCGEKKESRTCWYFLKGNCKNERCSFLHEETRHEQLNKSLHCPKPNASKNAPSARAKDTDAHSSKHTRVDRRGKNSNGTSVTRTMSITECVGRIYSMAKDQHGCRFLQKKLNEDKTPLTCKLVFEELLPHIVELMLDHFANYLCQKFIEKCSVNERLKILRTISGELAKIGKDMYGTRALQKLIDHLNTKDEIEIMREGLKDNVVYLIEDLNGNRVIQKCIHKFGSEHNQFIYDTIAKQCVRISTHRHGCCVMQCCLDYSTDQQRAQLVNEIKKSAFDLVQDQFGNYVVQYVLDLGIDSIFESLSSIFSKHLFYFSTQKFSSNVIEKCLKIDSGKLVRTISKKLAELCCTDLSAIRGLPDGFRDDPLVFLLQHPYGNYVIQTILQEASVKAVAEWRSLAHHIRSRLNQLRNTLYLRRIQVLLSNSPDGSASRTKKFSRSSPRRRTDKKRRTKPH
ncbi:uncharacterized protein LOC126304747 [Schistocerca gregaria]|uniref:uncharacterized protein LOC126304747 n=1 Tax=Schistocerca gregaria TaxID=7010 RepID=UPI00211DA933|nr:uncharacterized protein LOC126304747 [Schistocerca gregaria]